MIATLVSADFKVAGVSGDLKLQTVSGQLSGDAGGDVRAGTVSGDVRLTARAAKIIEVKTISGDIHDASHRKRRQLIFRKRTGGNAGVAAVLETAVVVVAFIAVKSLPIVA